MHCWHHLEPECVQVSPSIVFPVTHLSLASVTLPRPRFIASKHCRKMINLIKPQYCPALLIYNCFTCETALGRLTPPRGTPVKPVSTARSSFSFSCCFCRFVCSRSARRMTPELGWHVDLCLWHPDLMAMWWRHANWAAQLIIETFTKWFTAGNWNKLQDHRLTDSVEFHKIRGAFFSLAAATHKGLCHLGLRERETFRKLAAVVPRH